MYRKASVEIENMVISLDRVRGQRLVRVMGILNVTPDSFSRDGLGAGGVCDIVERSLEQASLFVSAGVDILDIGGESTRPGAAIVSESEECDRVLPVIEAVRGEFSDILLSIDSYKAGVVERALLAGAGMINDVSALRGDERMGAIASRAGVPIILMHNRSRNFAVDYDSRLGSSYVGADYADVVRDVVEDLRGSVDLALGCGILAENIILDPGIGFGKSVVENMALIDGLSVLKELGYDVLLGPSRKSFIGKVLDREVESRLGGTLACVGLGVMRGADIVRVHDVASVVDFVRMLSALLESGRG